MKKIDIYLCSTPYHIFCALLLLNKNKKESILILSTKDKKVYNYFKKIMSRILDNEYILKAYQVKMYENKIIDFFMTNFNNKKILKEIDRYYIIEHTYFFVWNIHTLYRISNFWYNKLYNFIFVEDGSTAYAFPKPSRKKILLKKYFFKYDFNFLNSNKIVYFLLQYPEKYNMINKKKVKLDLNYLINIIDFEYNKYVTEVFLSENKNIYESMIKKDNLAIIFTQPLSEDGFISEYEKKLIYADIVNKNKSYNLVLKKHPRENTFYNFKDVIILNDPFPSELFLLHNNLIFKKSISLCSSSSYNVAADVNEIIDDNFFDNLRRSKL